MGTAKKTKKSSTESASKDLHKLIAFINQSSIAKTKKEEIIDLAYKASYHFYENGFRMGAQEGKIIKSATFNEKLLLYSIRLLWGFAFVFAILGIFLIVDGPKQDQTLYAGLAFIILAIASIFLGIFGISLGPSPFNNK